MRRPPSSAPSHRARRLVPAVEPGEGIARRRLSLLLQRLDRWLDDRPKVERDARGRTVWVFGAVGYRVDERRRAVYPVFRDGVGRVAIGRYTMELLRPLTTPHFLPCVLRHLRLTDGGRQRHLFRGEKTIAAEEYRISLEAYRRLRRDPRFRELRDKHLPAALGLDPVLVAVTLQARRTLAARVATDEYTHVWRHGKELRRVARENPGLLPLAACALDEGWILPCGDSVKELHCVFREQGLSPATWRYFARHGSRMLQPVFSRVVRGHRTRGVVEFLRELERAGHPGLPPPWVIEMWLGFSRGGRRMLGPHWNPIPPEVVRIALGETCRVRGTPAELVLREDLPVVFEWAGNEEPKLDKPQQRAGWAWLQRRAAQAERRQLLLEATGPRSWPSVVGTLEKGGLRATALETVEQVVDEGMAFHNCIATYIADCQRGGRRLFVLQETGSGRRVAVARLDHRAQPQYWALRGVLGFANAPVGDSVQVFAEHIARVYDERMRGAKHTGVEAVDEDFGDLLSAMEEQTQAGGGSSLEPGG